MVAYSFPLYCTVSQIIFWCSRAVLIPQVYSHDEVHDYKHDLFIISEYRFVAFCVELFPWQPHLLLLRSLIIYVFGITKRANSTVVFGGQLYLKLRTPNCSRRFMAWCHKIASFRTLHHYITSDRFIAATFSLDRLWRLMRLVVAYWRFCRTFMPTACISQFPNLIEIFSRPLSFIHDACLRLKFSCHRRRMRLW